MKQYFKTFLNQATGLIILFALSTFSGPAWSQTWQSPIAANSKFLILDQEFQADSYIIDQACLMVELYHHLDENEAIFFDGENPKIILGYISLKNLMAKPAADSLANTLKNFQNKIFAITQTEKKSWTKEDQNFREHFPPDWKNDEIAGSAKNITYRLGMRRGFRTALELAHPLQNYFDSIFKITGIPSRLKYLAYVESRFNPSAESPAGAAGIWQLLKVSSQPFLTIDDRIDQRFDPLLSTVAAAEYLKQCHQNLQSWPLAIMAYNNGPSKIRDAVLEMESSDPSNIIQKFSAPSFGAISKNYYAMYLAASSLGMQSNRLYPTLRKKAPFAYKTLRLENSWTPQQLRILSGYSTAVLKQYNPSLKDNIFSQNLTVPKGFLLKLPPGMPTEDDLLFADLQIGIAASNYNSQWKLPRILNYMIPNFAKNSIRKFWAWIYPSGMRENVQTMAFMREQGVLNQNCLSLAKQDRILIEPHPALHFMIQGMAMLEKVGG